VPTQDRIGRGNGGSLHQGLTEAGRNFTGVLAVETATSIMVRAEEKKGTIVVRKDIDEMEASKVSMIPPDMEKVVTPILHDAFMTVPKPLSYPW
jgi:hypothetical protein